MILCSLKFQLFYQDLSRLLVSTKDLKLAHVDSRARPSRSHQVFKEESNSWIKFGSSQDREEDFQEKTCVKFVRLRFLF